MHQQQGRLNSAGHTLEPAFTTQLLCPLRDLPKSLLDCLKQLPGVLLGPLAQASRVLTQLLSCKLPAPTICLSPTGSHILHQLMAPRCTLDQQCLISRQLDGLWFLTGLRRQDLGCLLRRCAAAC